MDRLKYKFVKYVSLNVIGMIGLSCYILADTFFIAKALGTIGLASLNFSISVFSIIQGLGLMIGIGGAIDFTIRTQQNDRNNISFTLSLMIGALFSIAFILVSIFLTTQLSILLGADATTLPYTKEYLSTILRFSPFFILNNILLCFIRNDKNPRLSVIAMLVSSFSNIMLDYIFMFPLSMGMHGAALATSLSPIISLCILSIHFVRKKHSFYITRCKLQFNKMLRIMSLGFSSFIGELASAISLITFNLIILRLEGNVGVAAYGIVANIALVATAILVGVSQGLQPLASKYYGNGNNTAVNRVLRFAVLTAVILSIIIYLAVYLSANQIVSVFNNQNNEELTTLAVQGIRIYFIGYVFAGVTIVATAFMSAITRARQAIIVSTLRSCLILVPAIVISSILFKTLGVWLSFVITELIVLAITTLFLKKYNESSHPISTTH